ncbi:ras GEF [Sodiomyces alkalinus F11]|uniref:Class E vacuolar protein-sorting machinery protein HSE1 n=1 Tax=Sodiomyces alkalinus (strain CBS 110278 / VKM F-3762 / F11) TaxID=1314773 RepID=A0A3N2PWH1_SODAK|nr:ras GEF [Sodiomyces alkalinus F11]ROT38848.1 ras GEF [Sodiomyces alkalinus F11]
MAEAGLAHAQTLETTTRIASIQRSLPETINISRGSGRHCSITELQATCSDQRAAFKSTQSVTSAMNGIVGTAPPGTMYVRALYDYEADDRTSLSFHEGDIIQVITQLESGWWDGVINGVRGWFPSNYCQIITGPEDNPESDPNEQVGRIEDEPQDQESYEEHFDEDAGSDEDSPNALPMEGTQSADTKSRADFWIPQATPDGRLFYYNMMTGDRSLELPLESPVSASEAGPRDRINIPIPDRTRLPPEMLARGLTQDEDDDSDTNSASEIEGESLMLASRSSLPRKRRSFNENGLSHSTSMDSINDTSPATRNKSDPFVAANLSMNATPIIASSTSFTSTSYNAPSTSTVPRSFFDDGLTPPLTWTRLVSDMRRAIDRYRDAVTRGTRSAYVARAEDISDHLRLLLAAGSGTTDNHSGQPSIISTNKALYPHFRDMMSKFSKLVISSHIAAADWPNPESVQKCLQEADGVLLGVFSYVEIARQQRGEEIPRLFPGFVIGSSTGGSWQNNGLGRRDPITANFLEDEEGVVEPTTPIDGKLLERLDEYKRMLVFSIRELEKHLVISDKVVTAFRHELIGNNVCSAGGKVLETFKPWIALVESIDLSLNNSLEMPQVSDFNMNKQCLYDTVSDLLLGCQAVAGPVADEWAEIHGEALENRLQYAQQCAKALETNASHMGFSLQLLSEQVLTSPQQQSTQHEQQVDPQPRDDFVPREQLRRGETMPYERTHQRTDSRPAPVRPPLMTSQSFSEGDSAAGNFRKGDYSKVRRVLGDVPNPVEDTPEFLMLDQEHDLSWDTKTPTPTVKGGTLLALVEQLTRHDKLDSNFNNTFLLTYRSFTTARELFELLVSRFSVQPPEGLSPADFELWRDKKQKFIRVRVVNILKSWFDNFWMEDYNEESKRLIRDVYAFARDNVKSTETPGAALLMTILDQRLSGKEAGARRMIQTVNQSTPAPIMPKNMKKLKFLDIDVTEFARQLTIIESRLYSKIKPTECLNKTWQKKVAEGETEPAPNVKLLILHSNQMTNWVAEMILSQMDVRKRVVVIKHFVAVADKCRSLNNFSTLTSIISALGTAPIARLKRTWDQVPQRTQSVLESMRRLMASTKNFGEYREALHAANPPCIPFFGVYLTDLTFIEDGIPSVIKRTNLINFAKRSKTAEVIRDIQQYQAVGYSLQPVPELQDYILINMQGASDVHEMYDRSLQVEPREREDEKIVRYVTLGHHGSFRIEDLALVLASSAAGHPIRTSPFPLPNSPSPQQQETKDPRLLFFAV